MYFSFLLLTFFDVSELLLANVMILAQYSAFQIFMQFYFVNYSIIKIDNKNFEVLFHVGSCEDYESVFRSSLWLLDSSKVRLPVFTLSAH